MRISIIGTGYVGLVSGACFAEIGHECVCVDMDPRKVELVNRGEPPIHEAGLEPMLRRWVGSRLRATTDLREAVLASEVTFIAVGTPFDGHRIDLKFIREAARQVGAVLREKSGYHVVAVKSTVVPGTTDEVVRPVLEEASGRRAGADFGLGMNPEFLTEGVAVDDFMRPDRIVVGGIDERTVETLTRIYAAFERVPLLATNNKTAEMIKYASNSLLATLISFSNEIANVCSALGGVDAAEVLRGVHLARYFSTTLEDARVVTAPITSFLWPGCGYGGSCLPKDTQALSAHAAAHGRAMPLLDAVIDTNLRQPSQMMNLLRRHFPALQGVRVAVLGIAFKEDTDDVRESPAVPLMKMLAEAGVKTCVYDPVVRHTADGLLPPAVTHAPSLSAAIADVDAVLLVTRWPEFRELPKLLRAQRAPPLLIDGRRMIEPFAVSRYAGIGL